MNNIFKNLCEHCHLFFIPLDADFTITIIILLVRTAKCIYIAYCLFLLSDHFVKDALYDLGILPTNQRLRIFIVGYLLLLLG